MAGNYRLVRLICRLHKCLERLIGKHIIVHSTEHGLLYKVQYGFLKCRIRVLSLPCFSDAVTANVNKGNVSKICYFDLSKAFVFVIRGLHQWFRDYLPG